MNRFTRAATLIGSAALSFCATLDPSAAASPWSLFWMESGRRDPVPALVVSSPPAIQLAAKARHFTNGSFPGPAVDAYYGVVQVQANIVGGRLTSIEVLQYPSDRRTSRVINAEALPILEREVISAQSARVDAVSGATLTSRAYLRSMSVALHQAGG